MKELIYGFWMLVGTYTGGESEGIYVYGFDPDTARTEYVGMAPVENPSYLTASADGSMVYAVSENDGENPSLANAFEFDAATGALTLLNSEETGGAAPCNIATNGDIVVAANYVGGDISVFGIEEGGGLTPLRQTLRITKVEKWGESDAEPWKGSHMHCVKFSPDGKYLFATDLGTDRILRWRVRRGRIDERSLEQWGLAEDSGPRHFIFDGEGKNLYLINEYSGTVMAFGYRRGELDFLHMVQADTAGGRGSADIVLTPDGRWLYASHRLKNDGVSIFSVNPDDGTLSPAGYRTTGIHPRNLSISPGGKYLLAACRDSNSIEIFEIDYATGALTPTGKTIALDRPVCVMFVKAGKYREPN